MAEQTAVATQKKYGIDNKGIDGLTTQLKDKQQKGLKFPTSYSLENALNSAYLMLKQATDKNDKPLLDVCTQTSVVNSLMSMATQGLNPVKKQCYFVAMGSTCTLMPSYFGTLAVTKRVANVTGEPVANVIYKGDVFEYAINVDTGEKKILKHEQKIENIDNASIVGAYAIVRTDKMDIVEIMNINQIHNSWGMGAAKGNSKAHNLFSEEMVKKTVLNRACKQLINSSDDSSLVSDETIQEFNNTLDNEAIDVAAIESKEEIGENANKEEFEIPVETFEGDVVGEAKQEPINNTKGNTPAASTEPDWMPR